MHGVERQRISTQEYRILRAQLEQYFKTSDLKLIVRDPDKPYVNVKTAYGYPHALGLIRDCVAHNINPETTCLVGGGYGYVPLVSALQTRFGYLGSYLREEPDSHTGSMYNGHTPGAHDKVTVMEDFFSSGGSLKALGEAARKTGARVLGGGVVVRKGDQDIGMPVSQVFWITDLL